MISDDQIPKSEMRLNTHGAITQHVFTSRISVSKTPSCSTVFALRRAVTTALSRFPKHIWEVVRLQKQHARVEGRKTEDQIAMPGFQPRALLHLKFTAEHRLQTGAPSKEATHPQNQCRHVASPPAQSPNPTTSPKKTMQDSSHIPRKHHEG